MHRRFSVPKAPSTTTAAGSSDIPSHLFGYDVVSRIGRGAASTMYCVSNSSGQLFALKHVLRHSEKDDRFIQQLQTELEMTQKFRHPALRKAIEFKTPRKFFSNKINEAALILEWVDGEPLDEHAPSDLPTLLGLFAHCAGALASMHHLRLVHCDFKPNNVLICDGDTVKVIDFGQTCKDGTAKQRVQGTPDYIAPSRSSVRRWMPGRTFTVLALRSIGR